MILADLLQLEAVPAEDETNEAVPLHTATHRGLSRPAHGFHIAASNVQQPEAALSLRTTPFTDPVALPRGFWALPRAAVGDAPGKYHLKYLMAVLTASSDSPAEGGSASEIADRLAQWPVPAIGFDTDEGTRRSMTLNGMRMATEYSANGSRRLLQLVDSRLTAGQPDVVHDVLVYLMNCVLDTRANANEARLLRAEAVAAFLGLERPRVDPLFLRWELNGPEIARHIGAGKAGALRRDLEIEPLIAHQLELLAPDLAIAADRERRWIELMREIIGQLETS